MPKYPLNPDQVIWRYINHERFELLVKQRALFFSQASRFDDKNEGQDRYSPDHFDNVPCDLSPNTSKM